VITAAPDGRGAAAGCRLCPLAIGVLAGLDRHHVR
jgi:hypothetical protein